jgi:hypothetical protein
MQGKEGLGLGISKEELTIRVIDSTKSSRRSDTKVCHAMDERSTTKVDQMDEVCQRFQGQRNNEWPQVCPTTVNSVGFSNNDP